jgi:hypothetical protein
MSRDIGTEVKVVVNGNCPICRRRLKGNRLFLCEECSEKVARAIWETHFSEPYTSVKGANNEFEEKD